jgi:membrane-bound lytic murein transglycosylase B
MPVSLPPCTPNAEPTMPLSPAPSPPRPRRRRAPALLAVLALFLGLAVGPLGGTAQAEDEAAATPVPRMADYLARPEYKDLIATLVNDHGFSRAEVEQWFGEATLIPRIVKIFDRPAEAKPYAEYRNLFISPKVRKLGARYLKEHRALLEQVEARTGVAATTVAAIMGIETKFGSVKPGYKAFDALNSAFALYPRRRPFFRKELIEYLLLCREERADPFSLHSSYAGALGMPQFMPSSFRAYAVDFDGDGRRDIWASQADVAGSIGNYLKVHGWQPGQPLRAEVHLTPAQAERFDGGHKERIPLTRLTDAGVTSPAFAQVPPDEKVAVVSYDDAGGTTRYFVLFTNFLTIMRYNTSVNYALVAAELDDYFRGLT